MLLQWNNIGGAGGVSVPWSSTPSALLPPGFSLTRASTGTYFDSAGLLQTAPVNLCLQSQTFGTTWVPSNSTVTANSTVAPDGTTTADSIVATGTIAGIGQSFTKAASAIQYTQSVFVAPSAKNWVVITLWDGASVGSRYWFQLTGNGAVGSTAAIGAGFTGLSARISVAANGFFRAEFTATSNSATSLNVVITAADGDGTFSSATSGTQFIVWGSQLETGSAATSYIPTTTTVNSAARGTYRWNGSAWVFDGTIVEAAAATNNCLQSADFTTTWTAPAGATVTANQYTAPDGTTTMDRLNVSAGNTQHYLQQANTATSAGANTLSVYLRYVNHQWVNLAISDGTNASGATFDLLNGVVGSTGYVIGSGTVSSRITAIGGGVYRCEVTSTHLANAASTVFIAASNSTAIGVNTWNAAGTEQVGLWGAQLEFSGAATSYIPTTTATVTRSADVLTAPTSGLLANAQGFAAAGYRVVATPVAGQGSLVSTFNGTEGAPLYLFGGNVYLFDGTGSRVGPAITVNAGTQYKVASTWGGSNCAISANGTVVSGLTFDGDMNLGATTRIGAFVDGSNGFSMVLQSLRLGTRAATNSELAGWTT